LCGVEAAQNFIKMLLLLFFYFCCCHAISI
jgi:hypothetical protein